MIKATAQDIATVAKYVESRCGIVLNDTKSYLVESRLGPLLQPAGVSSYSALIAAASRDKSGRLQRLIIDAITTNETYFFRDNRPFELLAHKLIPDVLEHNAGPRPSLRIWSAAASTGQEIYSVAMILAEMLGRLDRYDIRLLGTDISDAALQIASRAMYGKVELSRGISGVRLQRHFEPVETLWKIRDELRALVAFRRLNLLEDVRSVPKQDIILCRNVAVYFSRENKQRLFSELAGRLYPHGALLIGSTETLVGLDVPLVRREFHKQVYYTPHAGGAAP